MRSQTTEIKQTQLSMLPILTEIKERLSEEYKDSEVPSPSPYNLRSNYVRRKESKFENPYTNES